MAHLTLVPHRTESPGEAETLLAELSELLDTLRSKNHDDLEMSLEAARRRRKFKVIVGGADAPVTPAGGSSPCDERANQRVGIG